MSGADRGDDGVERDVLVVVAEVGLRGRGEDRLGQPAAVDQPGRQRDAADLAGRVVVEQPGPGQVAARDALDGIHREVVADDGTTGDLGRHVGADDVVGHQVGELLEPPQRRPGEDLALVGDRRLEHEVEDRQPVARDHQQLADVRALGQLVEVAHLARVDVAGAGQRRRGRDVRERHGDSLGAVPPARSSPHRGLDDRVVLLQVDPLQRLGPARGTPPARACWSRAAARGRRRRPVT